MSMATSMHDSSRSGSNYGKLFLLNEIIAILQTKKKEIKEDIKKNSKLTINIRGEFAKALSKKGGDSIIKKVINLLKKKYNIKNNFKIILDKNIPLGAGLGGGSADAAAVTRLIFKMYKLNVSKKHIISHLSNVGADVPACYFSYNQKVEGFGDKLTKLRLLNKSIWALIK